MKFFFHIIISDDDDDDDDDDNNNNNNNNNNTKIIPTIIVVFERWKMVESEGLQVLNERMKTIDPGENEIYKFLGAKQADKIKKKEVYNRVKEEISRRMNIITRTEINDKNLVKAINTKVIP